MNVLSNQLMILNIGNQFPAFLRIFIEKIDTLRREYIFSKSTALT